MGYDPRAGGHRYAHGLVMRDQKFQMGIHEAVDTNAILLDDVVAALGRLETQMAAVVATSEQTTSDVKNLKGYTEQDTQLRIELDRMGSRLETANTELMDKLAALDGELMAKFAVLEGIATSGGKGGSKGSLGGPIEPPGLDGLPPIQAIVQAIEDALRSLVPKVEGLEGAQGNAQAKVVSLLGEHDHFKAFIGKKFQALKNSLGQELEAVKNFVQKRCIWKAFWYQPRR